MSVHETQKKEPLLFQKFQAGVLVCFLFFSPWFYGLTGFRDQLIVQLVIFAFFLISLFALPRSFSVFWNSKSIDFWMALSLVGAAASVVISVLPYQSFLTFLRWLSVVLVYFLTRAVVRHFNMLRFFLWMILAAGAAYSMYGLAQYYGFLSADFWYKRSFLASRYINSSHFASFLLIAIFAGFSLILASRKFLPRVFILTLLSVILWALVLTKARTVWVSLLGGSLIYLWLLKSKKLLRPSQFLGIFAAVAIGLLILVQTGGASFVIKRWNVLWNSETGQAYNIDQRLAFWTGSLHAFSARPWGWGLGSFVHIFPRFAVHSDRFLVDYAHNEFFQIGVDLGLFGVLWLLGFLFAYFRDALAFLNSPRIQDSFKIAAAACASSAAGMLMVCQFDFPLRIYATGIIFFVYLGCHSFLFDSTRPPLANTSERIASDKGSFRYLFLKTAAALLLLILAVPASRQLFAANHFKKGTHLEEIFEWDRAKAEYEKAISWAPLYNEYYEALGRLYRKKSLLSFQRDEKRISRRRAIEAFEKTVKLHPYWPASFYMLARLYKAEGNNAKTDFYYDKAVHLAPRNSLFVYEYSLFALHHGNGDKAVRLFEHYQSLPFKENTETDACVILREFYPHTPDYHQLKRVIADRWQDRVCLGFILGENNRWDEAERELSIAMKKARTIYDYDRYLEHVGSRIAEFYLSHDRFQKALAIYEDALSRNPANPYAKSKFEEISKKMERHKQTLSEKEASLYAAYQRAF